MRRGRSSWTLTVVAALLLLVVGTLLGRALALGPLSRAIGFTPITLNLYVLSVTVGVATNALGLLGAVVGLIVVRPG